jgi:hypothetical protein
MHRRNCGSPKKKHSLEFNPLAAQSRINWTNFVTVVGAIILVGAEVFGVAFAAAWALAGMLELSETFRWGLMAGFGGVGLWAMLVFWRKANQIEPVFERG